jgi:SAM-dependent methyltransferase
MTARREGDRWLWENPGLTAATMPPEGFENLIERSIKTMHELFRPLRSDYGVRGFRARAYDVEPFSLIAPTLLRHGIRADSSYHGLGPIPVRTPTLSHAVHPRDADFLEFPIYSVNNQRWDFSGPPEFTNLPLKVPEPIPDRPLGLVMIGHSKQKIHYEAVDACLSKLTKRHGTRLRFVRWQESIENYLPHLHGNLFPGRGFGKDYFDACWDKEDPFQSSAVEDPYYQRILDLLPNDTDSLLDLGCAEGVFTQALATRSKAKTVLGIDISSEAIRRAAQAHPQLEFQAKNLLHFEATKRFSCVVSSQNIYYFTAAERAVLFAHIESMLTPEGQFLLAWWTGANRGYQEEGIEDEFKRFFRIAHSETYEGPTNNAIKGAHRILIGKRRLTMAEEDLLNRIYWKGKTVLSLCRRGEDIRPRFGWMTKAWKTHLPRQGLPQPVDVLLVDVVNQERLDALKVNGTLIVFPAGELDANLEGVIWIKQDKSLALGTKSSPDASINHPRGSQQFARTPRTPRRHSNPDVDGAEHLKSSPLSRPFRPYYDTDDPFLRYIHPLKRPQKTGMNILVANSGSNVCELSTLLMKAINEFSEHKARCVVAFPARMTNELAKRTTLLDYQEDLVLSELDGDLSEVEELIERADFFHCCQGPSLPGTSLTGRLKANNSVIQYIGREVFQNLDFLTEFHTKTGTIPLLSMGSHVAVNLPRRFMYFYPILNLEEYKRCPRAKPGEEIRLVHSPTSRSLKGTDEFLEIAKPLEKKFNFKVILIENKSHKKCIEIKQTCHLHFDQMSPWGFGVSGMESMAMGHVVLCSMTYYRLSLQLEVPLVSISAATLPAILKDLLSHPQNINEIGDQAYEWVRKTYDPQKLIKRYCFLYQGIMNGFEAVYEGWPSRGEPSQPLN